jgi:hypothetical protein
LVGCASSKVDPHGDSRAESVITDVSLVIANGLMTWRQSFDDAEAEPGVERCVPRHVSEGGQSHGGEAMQLRPVADGLDQSPPAALLTFRWEYRELPDVGETIDDLDTSEPNRWRPRDEHDRGLG